MNMNRRNQRPRSKAALVSMIVPVAVCAFAITLTSVAQIADPVPASSMAAAKDPTKESDQKPDLHFKAPTLPALKKGVPYAFNLCSNQAVSPLPKDFSDTVGQKMDTQLTPCGEQSTTAANTVAGGNPPYSFQLDTGSFPPLGMHLGLNGLLYGTPAPPTLGGYKPFRVCAVDLSAHADCHEVTISTQPAVKAHSKTPLLLGTLGAAGVAGVVGARAMSNSTSSSGGTETGTCNGTAPTNACGACSCTDGGTCNQPSAQCGGDYCTWAGPGSTVPNAPFCP